MASSDYDGPDGVIRVVADEPDLIAGKAPVIPDSRQGDAVLRRADVEESRTDTRRLSTKSRALVISVVIAFILDGILWTVVVPILPTYLHDIDHDVNKDSTDYSKSQSRDVTTSTLGLSRNRGRDVTATRFALADDSFYEWVDDNSRPLPGDYHRGDDELPSSHSLWYQLMWMSHNWTEPGVGDNKTFEHLADAADSSRLDGVGGRDVVDFQQENSKLGLLFAAKAIVQLFANPVVGILTNRFGPNIPLLSGVVILMASSLVYAIGANYALMVTARAIHGLSSSCINIAGMTALSLAFNDDKRRSRAMGFALGGLGFGILVGYPFGGVCSEFTGKLVPFLVIALLALFELNIRVDLSEAQQQQWRYGALLLPEMAMATIEPTVPTWMLDTMNAKRWEIGLVFVPDSIGFFIGSSAFGIVAYKLGRWRVTLCALVVAGVSLFMIPFATHVTHLIGPHFGFGFALGVTDAAVMPLLAHLVDTRHSAVYGSVYSIAQFAVSLGFAVGPAVGGQLVRFFGFSWLLRGLAILHIVYAPLCCLLQEHLCLGGNRSIQLKQRKSSCHVFDCSTSASVEADRREVVTSLRPDVTN